MAQLLVGNPVEAGAVPQLWVKPTRKGKAGKSPLRQGEMASFTCQRGLTSQNTTQLLKSRAGKNMPTAIAERDHVYIENEAIRKSAEQFALNTYNLRPLKNETPEQHRFRVIRDLASAIIEMGKKPEDRTNPVAISVADLKKLAQRSRQERNEKAIDQAENSATERLLADIQRLPSRFLLTLTLPENEISEKVIWRHLLPHWPKISPDISETLFWLSPPSEERGLAGKHEARFCFYFKGLVNNEPYLILFAVCGQQDEEQCLDLASQLTWNHGDNPADIPQTSQELRENPLTLFFSEGKMWDILSNYFGNKRIFENIVNGTCFENKIKAYTIAQKVYLQIQRYLYMARTERDFFQTGVALEQAINDAGGHLYSISSCGISYRDRLTTAAYTKLYSSGGERSGRFRHCGGCDRGRDKQEFGTEEKVTCPGAIPIN